MNTSIISTTVIGLGLALALSFSSAKVSAKNSAELSKKSLEEQLRFVAPLQEDVVTERMLDFPLQDSVVSNRVTESDATGERISHDLTAYFEKHLIQNVTFNEGGLRLTVHFSVDANGTPTNIVLTSGSLINYSLRHSIEKAVKSLKNLKSDASATESKSVSYSVPIVFDVLPTSTY